jgi:hypothetical protein
LLYIASSTTPSRHRTPIRGRPRTTRARRMLASTFQQPNTTPTNTPTTHQCSFSEGGPKTSRSRVILQDPTVCQAPPPHQPSRFHTPPARPPTRHACGHRTRTGSTENDQQPTRESSSTIPLASSTTSPTPTVRDIHGH